MAVVTVARVMKRLQVTRERATHLVEVAAILRLDSMDKVAAYWRNVQRGPRDRVVGVSDYED